MWLGWPEFTGRSAPSLVKLGGWASVITAPYLSSSICAHRPWGCHSGSARLRRCFGTGLQSRGLPEDSNQRGPDSPFLHPSSFQSSPQTCAFHPTLRTLRSSGSSTTSQSPHQGTHLGSGSHYSVVWLYHGARLPFAELQSPHLLTVAQVKKDTVPGKNSWTTRSKSYGERLSLVPHPQLRIISKPIFCWDLRSSPFLRTTSSWLAGNQCHHQVAYAP